ncbi:MAG: hypothetical protein Q7T55_22720 [Solirubrobacteraceae bacterium]|nr:hypothetical protein [Solirubrobacteraceae bacterium]
MFDPTDPIDPDDQLMAELGDLFGRTDPVPSPVTLAAYAAIELRDLDAQLAELLSDSAVEDRELAGVRSTATPTRLLTFSLGEDEYIEVDVAEDGETRALTGYVVPSSEGRFAVEHASGALEGDLDEHGRFSIDGVPSGPARLRFLLPGRAAIVTPWLPI